MLEKAPLNDFGKQIWLMELQLRSDSELQLLAILHIDFFFFFQILFFHGFDYLTSSYKVCNIFKFNLSLQSSTFCYVIIIIIIIIIIIHL